MENRRAYYRHEFQPEEQMPIGMESTKAEFAFPAVLLNMSLGGIQIRIETPGVHLSVNESLLGKTTLLRFNQDVTFPLSPRYFRSTNGAIYCGLAFRTTAAGRLDEERERLLWRFLYEEQTRAIRQAREAG